MPANVAMALIAGAIAMPAAQQLAIRPCSAIIADASVVLAESISIAKVVTELTAVTRVTDAFS